MQQKFEKVQLFLEYGDLERALEETRLLLAEDSENPDVWCLEGIVRLALQEFQAAERSFDRACDLSPNNPVPILHKARFLLAVEETDEAIRLGEKALQWAESSEARMEAYLVLAQAHLAHADALQQVWHEDLAAEEEERVRSGFGTSADDELPPLPPEIQALLEKGLSIVEKALEVDREHPEAWLLQALFSTNLNRLQDAVESWEKALEFDPDNGFFLHELGSLRMILEDIDKARDAFQQLYELEVVSNEQEGLEFAHYEFEEAAQQALSDLQEDFLETVGVTLPINLIIQEYPEAELLEQAPARQPFDPWTACHVEIDANSSADISALHFRLFQRNVERQLVDDNPEQLYLSLYDLLRQILLESLELMQDNEVIEA